MYVSINTEFFHFEQWEGNEGDSACLFDIFQIIQLTHFIILGAYSVFNVSCCWVVWNYLLKGFKSDLFILNPQSSIVGVFSSLGHISFLNKHVVSAAKMTVMILL